MLRVEFDKAGETLALPSDGLGFLRHECPDCHRQFKVRGTELDAQLLLQRLSSLVTMQNADESDGLPMLRTCPYCAVQAPDGGWFTAEQRAWLEKQAKAFGAQVRFELLSLVERTLAQNPYPTFLPVRPADGPGALRAEPDDMRVVPLLCCGDAMKVSETWVGLLRCFFCGCEHEYGEALVRQRLTGLIDS